MPFFHLRSLAGQALPDAYCQVWSAYLSLDRSQWLDPPEIERQQLEQARSLLAHCYAHVPYYRKLFPAAGIVPDAVHTMDDFRRIPLLSRRTYQEQLASFVAEQLPPGTVATGAVHTSGSSGTPLQVFQTNVGDLWWHGLYLRDLEWCNIDPTGTLAVIRSTGRGGEALARALAGVSVPYWQPWLQPLIETGVCHGMDISQDQRRQLQWLRGLSPTYLFSYPSNLEMLARLLGDVGPIPSLKAIQAISETLSEETQAAIEAAFGVPVKNTYSCIEAGYLASPCTAGQGLHVHAENVLLEVLDDAGRPCAPGQAGRVFLTCLHNPRAPLIRYEVGDMATLGPGPSGERCRCGRGLPLLARVQGKVSPFFRLPDGRRKNSTPLSRLVRKVGGHWQHQVVQKAVDHLVVRLAVNSTWTENHAEQVRQQVRDFFEAPVRIDLEIHDRLPMPPGGKFQCMVVELKP